MGATLEKYRCANVDAELATALNQCARLASEDSAAGNAQETAEKWRVNGWTVHQHLLKSLSIVDKILPRGVYSLDWPQFFQVFFFLGAPRSRIAPRLTHVDSGDTGDSQNRHSVQQRGDEPKPVRKSKIKRKHRERKKSMHDRPWNYNKQGGKPREARRSGRSLRNSSSHASTRSLPESRPEEVKVHGARTKRVESTTGTLLSEHALELAEPDCHGFIFRAFQQRLGDQDPRVLLHVALAGFALCSQSTVEHRLRFIFSMFAKSEKFLFRGSAREHLQRGSEPTLTLSLNEFCVCLWTALRAIGCLSNAHFDHVNLSLREVKDSCMHTLQNMKRTVRNFRPEEGIHFRDFEIFVHSFIMPCAPWLYNFLDNSSIFVYDPQEAQGLEPASASPDHGQTQTLSSQFTIPKLSSPAAAVEYGSRAGAFRANSKSILSICIVSMTSASAKSSERPEATSEAPRPSNTIGGTGFAIHMRRMLNNVQQDKWSHTPGRALDGARIITWNSHLKFSDSGEGTEAAENEWSYGLDIEVRVAEAVCGGCSVDIFKLVDASKFGMQVPVHAIRMPDKSWSGGIIGQLRLVCEVVK